MHLVCHSKRGIVAFILLLAVGLTACGEAGPGEGQVQQRTPLVEAVAARFGALPVEEVVPGTVRASNQVAIRSEVEGRVVEVMVKSGQAVRRGESLVRLDDVEARERLRQAEADVQLAEAAAAAARARTTELETRVARMRSLAAEKLVSAQELETLEAQLEALQASAREARARVELARAAGEERRSALAKTVVKAPVAGRLGERRVEVGMLVDPSDVLFVIGDLDELIVEVDLTESMLARVEEGQPVEIESRSGGAVIAAAISRISPFLAEESFTTRGEIDVDNRQGRLRPGMFVSVRILVGQSEQAALVPVSALWEDPETGDRGVFVVAEAAGLDEMPLDTTESPEQPRAIAFRPVAILAQGRGTAGVTGIDQGAWAVTVGQHLLRAELRAAEVDATSASAVTGRASVLARVRPVSWERVAELQSLQNEDLLGGFLDKQRKVARALGAEIPESEDAVDRVLQDAAAGAQPAAGDG